jgi:hypothetical protein
MLTKPSHHEMPIQIHVPTNHETATICTAYVVFEERVPQRVYGFYMVPPGQEWVGAALREWYGFQVKLGPWKQVENLSINRPVWEASILEQSRI